MAEPAARDRLSELPDSLILEILSLLEMEQVVRTTILSKRWENLWTTVPRLEFLAKEDESFIQGALANWNGEKIIKFNLVFQANATSDILDSWLLVPIQKNVEILDVCVGPNMIIYYCPLLPLFTCSSITKLSLEFSDLDLDLRFGDNFNVQLNQLKSLEIVQPYCLPDASLKRILCGAPLLEELMLFSLDINEHFNIRSTSLKTLVIGRRDGVVPRTVVFPNGTLSIWAPNLISLRFSGCVYGTLLLDVPSLTNAVVCFKETCDITPHDEAEDDPPFEMFDQFFRSLNHVEKLTLSPFSIELLLDMKENDMVAQFSKTKFLKLNADDAEGLLEVVGMFPELMTLVVEHDMGRCYYALDIQQCVAAIDACNSLASEMSVPNPFLLKLKTVEITWCMDEAPRILPLIQILLGNAHVLENIVFRMRGLGGDHKTFTMVKNKLLSMQRSSPTARLVITKISESDYFGCWW